MISASSVTTRLMAPTPIQGSGPETCIPPGVLDEHSVVSVKIRIDITAWTRSSNPESRKAWCTSIQIRPIRIDEPDLRPTMTGVKTCSYCGRENDDTAAQCMECGTSDLAVPCGETVIPPDQPPASTLPRIWIGVFLTLV